RSARDNDRSAAEIIGLSRSLRAECQRGQNTRGNKGQRRAARTSVSHTQSVPEQPRTDWREGDRARRSPGTDPLIDAKHPPRLRATRLRRLSRGQRRVHAPRLVATAVLLRRDLVVGEPPSCSTIVQGQQKAATDSVRANGVAEPASPAIGPTLCSLWAARLPHRPSRPTRMGGRDHAVWILSRDRPAAALANGAMIAVIWLMTGHARAQIVLCTWRSASSVACQEAPCTTMSRS